MSLKKYAELKKAEKTPTQPKKCVGCVEGRWEGTVQYCMSIKGCVRDGTVR